MRTTTPAMWTLVALSVLGGCGTTPDRSPVLTVSPGGPERGELREVTTLELGDRHTVRPTINGQAVGPVLFDTGAAGLVVTPAVGRRLGLPVLPATETVSGAGTIRTPRRYVETFELGGLVVEDIRAVEVPLDFIGRAGGEKIAGLVGAPVYKNALVEIDLGGGRVRLHPQGSEPRAGLDWTRVRRTSMGMAVEVSVEGTEPGWFLIDTGSESGVLCGLGFTSERGLLVGRETVPEQIAFVGGPPMRSLRSTIGAVRVGGHTEGAVMGSFVFNDTTDLGAVDGVIGSALLDRFVVYLDWTRRRAAFVPRGG